MNGGVMAAATAEAMRRLDFFTSGLPFLCSLVDTDCRTRGSVDCHNGVKSRRTGASSASELVPRPERLRDAPGLGDAPTWREGRVAVEDLGDGADAMVAEVVGERRQERAGRRGVAVRLEVGQGERSEEPRPHRALMVRAVAFPLIAAVVTSIIRMAGHQAPEPERGQQMTGAGIDDPFLALRRQRALAQRDGEDLIGPERLVVTPRRVENVVAMAGTLAPEPVESRFHTIGEGVPRAGGPGQGTAQARHRAQRVVPEGVDLDRLARTRRDDPVAHLRVHPGELHTRLAGREQPVVRVLLDAVPRTP